ncbi:MAG: hypothetical protein OER04_17495 [Cyclobacteriaceae bacterium]|nr:hypothetical protein [Cyclobacteriaceae bacterium]
MLKFTTLLIFMSFLWVLNSPAQQRTLVLKHKTTGKVYEVDPQKAIRYRAQDGKKRQGLIEELTEEWMLVNGRQIAYDEITMLSSWHTRKNGGAIAGGALLTGFGALLMVGGVALTADSTDEDPLSTAILAPSGVLIALVGCGTSYLGLRAMKKKRFNMGEWDFVVQNY